VTPASPDPRTDIELIEAVHHGDTSAFDAIYFRYRDWVIRLALRFTSNRDDALDVLQETFIYLTRKMPELRLTAAMTTFLYPVVKHSSLSLLRKRRGVAELPDDVPVRANNGGGELPAVIAKLPPGQREVLLMRFVDDMQLNEIATALGVPVGTVKSRLHNAIATLRQDPATKDYFSE
jgi:RNA polymerase sigma-70 factor, ECF subfamily